MEHTQVGGDLKKNTQMNFPSLPLRVLSVSNLWYWIIWLVSLKGSIPFHFKFYPLARRVISSHDILAYLVALCCIICSMINSFFSPSRSTLSSAPADQLFLQPQPINSFFSPSRSTVSSASADQLFLQPQPINHFFSSSPYFTENTLCISFIILSASTPTLQGTMEPERYFSLCRVRYWQILTVVLIVQ
jgi:hypothetical protein